MARKPLSSPVKMFANAIAGEERAETILSVKEASVSLREAAGHLYAIRALMIAFLQTGFPDALMSDDELNRYLFGAARGRLPDPWSLYQLSREGIFASSDITFLDETLKSYIHGRSQEFRSYLTPLLKSIAEGPRVRSIDLLLGELESWRLRYKLKVETAALKAPQ